ncbi:unnamed protein product [Moneuplotes crassus]|uniref:Uncharacterized protein n=1 Tax=Euplotes crassus TaxID=5936 RepID=A0AAD1XZ00_EUPCR|nr:unnamed protein product [Moneuplotes crassus]
MAEHCLRNNIKTNDLRPGEKLRECYMKPQPEFDSESPCPTEESSIVLFNALETSLSMDNSGSWKNSHDSNYLEPKSIQRDDNRNTSIFNTTNKRHSTFPDQPCRQDLKIATIFDDETYSKLKCNALSSLPKFKKEIQSALPKENKNYKIFKNKRFSCNHLSSKPENRLLRKSKEEECKSDEISSSSKSDDRTNSESGENRKINSIQVLSKGMAFRSQNNPLKLGNNSLKASKVYSSCVKSQNKLQNSLIFEKSSKVCSMVNKNFDHGPNFSAEKSYNSSSFLNISTHHNSSSSYALTPEYKIPKKTKKVCPGTTKSSTNYLNKGGCRFEYFNKSKNFNKNCTKKKLFAPNKEYSSTKKDVEVAVIRKKYDISKSIRSFSKSSRNSAAHSARKKSISTNRSMKLGKCRSSSKIANQKTRSKISSKSSRKCQYLSDSKSHKKLSYYTQSGWIKPAQKSYLKSIISKNQSSISKSSQKRSLSRRHNMQGRNLDEAKKYESLLSLRKASLKTKKNSSLLKSLKSVHN